MKRFLPAVALSIVVVALPACRGSGPTPTSQTERPAKAARPEAKAPKPAPVAPKPKPIEVAWPTYHGPPSLDGCVSTKLPDALAFRWRNNVGASISNPPVVGAGRICVADDHGGLHAVTLSGKPAWSRTLKMPGEAGQPPRNIEYDAPLALFESTLLACSAGGRIYAMNAANGEIRWECGTSGPILGTVNFSVINTNSGPRKRLFVIDQSCGALQCVDFDTGQRLWRSKEIARCDGSPAVDSDVAVFGSCAAALHVFSAKSGALLHQVPVGEDSQVAAGVVLLGDSVFSGSRSGKIIHANVQTGATLWTNTDCQGETFATPAVNANLVIFTANDGYIYALDRATGHLKWKHRLGYTPSSPVIAGDKILVTTHGTLYLLRLSDGHKLWSYQVGDDATAPAMAGSMVIVGAGDGSLVAFGPASKG